jgi:hypothetical protein
VKTLGQTSILNVAFATALVFLSAQNSICQGTHSGAEDNCLSIVANSIKYVNSLPKEFNSSAMPSSGNNFCIVQLTIIKIKCGYIFPLLRDMTANTYIYDMNSNAYKSHAMVTQGLQLEDIHDITSRTAFREESIITVAFELPSRSNPSKIKLAYYHGASWKDRDAPDISTITVNLP